MEAETNVMTVSYPKDMKNKVYFFIANLIYILIKSLVFFSFLILFKNINKTHERYYLFFSYIFDFKVARIQRKLIIFNEFGFYGKFNKIDFRRK